MLLSCLKKFKISIFFLNETLYPPPSPLKGTAFKKITIFCSFLKGRTTKRGGGGKTPLTTKQTIIFFHLRKNEKNDRGDSGSYFFVNFFLK